MPDLPAPPERAADLAAGLSEDVLAVVERAMGLIREHFPAEGERWEVKLKTGPEDPLTAADLAADGFLREHLARLFPEAAMLTEESDDDLSRLHSSWVWIVDPVDGTRSLVEGRKGVAVSVALAHEGLPLLGVLGNPVTGERFVGVHGRGAREVSRGAMRVRPVDKLPERPALVVSSNEHRRGVWRPLEEKAELRTVGSTAYKMAEVARGDADAYVTPAPRSEWDVAAGHIIALEAGARVSDLEGREIRYNRPKPEIRGVVVAPAAVHEDLRSLVLPHLGASMGERWRGDSR